MSTKINSNKDFVLDILKSHKKKIVFITIIATFGSLLAVAIPYIYGRMFDLAKLSTTTISLLFSLILLWAILSLISNYTSNKTAHLGEILGYKISLEKEAEAYGHFLTLPIAYHKNKKVGGILNKISRSSWSLAMLIEVLSNSLPQFLILFFSIAIMFFIKWQLALTIILTFLTYIIITIKNMKLIIKTEESINTIFDKQYGNIYDKLYNVFLVKNFAMEEIEKKRIYNQLVDKTIPYLIENSKKWKSLALFQGMVYNIGFIIALASAIFFLRNGLITGGEFIMFFGYVNLSFSPFWRLTQLYQNLRKTGVAIKRLVKLKVMAPESMKHENTVLKDFKGEIVFDNVTFSYAQKRDVLQNINLKIKSGETVALVGKSGVGKTTLSELVIGYYRPKQGRILFDNVDISKLQLKWLRQQIAIVPQEISVLNDTLLNNIKYSNPSASLKDVVRATKAANAHEFIMKLPKKYNTIVGERGIKLSTGQKQRLALTMAFLKNPKILILDEPTASLDSESEVKVREGIHSLVRGRTTIIIAHRFSTVRNADKIVVLDKGRIVEIGKHHELIKKRGIYYHLYNLQSGLD